MRALWGLDRYFTGSECKHGHLSHRYASSTKCVACIAAYHERNKKRASERSKAYRNKTNRSEYFKSYHIKNIDRVRQRNKAWNASHKDRLRQYNKDHRAEKREHYKAYNYQNGDLIGRRLKVYREQNREKIYKKIKEWRARNKERVRVYLHKRRALKRGASGSHTALDLKEILRLQTNKCANCRIRFCSQVVPTLDHIVPLVKGGSNERRNLQFLCGPCNSSKKERDPIVFYRSQGMLL